MGFSWWFQRTSDSARLLLQQNLASGKPGMAFWTFAFFSSRKNIFYKWLLITGEKLYHLCLRKCWWILYWIIQHCMLKNHPPQTEATHFFYIIILLNCSTFELPPSFSSAWFGKFGRVWKSKKSPKPHEFQGFYFSWNQVVPNHLETGDKPCLLRWWRGFGRFWRLC